MSTSDSDGCRPLIPTHAVHLIYNVFTSVASLRSLDAMAGLSGRHGPESLDDFIGIRTYLRIERLLLAIEVPSKMRR